MRRAVRGEQEGQGTTEVEEQEEQEGVVVQKVEMEVII